MQLKRLPRGVYLLTVLFILSCATTIGNNFKYEFVRGISLNSTTEQEIRVWFGEPKTKNTVFKRGFKTIIYEYEYEKRQAGKNRVRGLSVEMKDNKDISFFKNTVNSYFFYSNLPEDASDFNTEYIDKLVIGKTTMLDVTNLLGKPAGIFQIPTNLLIERHNDIAPDSTYRIWVYSYAGERIVKGEEKLKVYESLAEKKTFVTKYLRLYFDSSEVLLFFENSESKTIEKK